jgi:hypothetical protein
MLVDKRSMWLDICTMLRGYFQLLDEGLFCYAGKTMRLDDKAMSGFVEGIKNESIHRRLCQ